MRINLLAGPGAGKSTMAAWLFSELKRRNISVEHVGEYVKGTLTLVKENGSVKTFKFVQSVKRDPEAGVKAGFAVSTISVDKKTCKVVDEKEGRKVSKLRFEYAIDEDKFAESGSDFPIELFDDDDSAFLEEFDRKVPPKKK